jgi:hypothetical protein
MQSVFICQQPDWICVVLVLIFFFFDESEVVPNQFRNKAIPNSKIWVIQLLVEETGLPAENHRPVASHWQTLSQTKTDYSNPFTRLQLYRNSFFPSSIKLWNNLTPEIRSAPTVSSFKKSLINDVNLLKPSRYYSYGCRVLNVLHTRLRHRSSNLNADLFRVNLINDPGCVCGWVLFICWS